MSFSRALLIVDATNELHRAYHTTPRAQHDGHEVGATRMFLRMLAKLARDSEHIIACFDDTTERCWRRSLWPEYKANRRNISDPVKALEQAEVRSQYALARDGARALGVTVASEPGYEADDCIATLAERFCGDFRLTLIVSPDKDLLQCLHGLGPCRVEALDRQRGKTVNVTDVVLKYGVLPYAIPDWIALVGDTSDGIPGVPGWGPKAASRFLAACRQVERIPHSADALTSLVEPPVPPIRGAEKLIETLNVHREDVALWKRLATLAVLETDALEVAGTQRQEPRHFDDWCRTHVGVPGDAVLRPTRDHGDDEAPPWAGGHG